MSWSIQQVARLSGVTARTLRYYDEIGLLAPARIGSNGYRVYDYDQLVRLQHILLLRALGVDLRSVAAVIDGGDRLATLRSHLERLESERDRLRSLIRTVSTTISHLERSIAMPADKMFQGFHFAPDTIDELEAAARERDGQAAEPYFEQLRRRTADWDEEQFRSFERESIEVEARVLALLRAGTAPDDPRVLDVLDDDVAVQRRIITLDAQEYAKLGEAFVNAPELRAHLDAQDPRLAEFLRDAMASYAAQRLA